MKSAVVHEWFEVRGGSEKVVEEILEVLPDSAVFSIVDHRDLAQRAETRVGPVTTSFIQHLPFSRRKFRAYLPLMPMAVERFDVSAYDVIVSSSHAVAKGVLTHSGQLHVSYVHTPMRYAWDLQGEYLAQAGLGDGVRGIAAHAVLHYLRQWDLATASRVDSFITNSQFVADRVWKTYRRPSTVIHPPVDIERFEPSFIRDDFYLVVGRLVSYKRVDLIVEAFNRLGLPLVIIGDGPERERLAQTVGANIQLLGRQPDDVVEDYMSRCRALVVAAEEDFGITTVEAQAAGAPVVGFRRGGTAEIVVDGRTGVLYDEPSVPAIINAVESLEKDIDRFSTAEVCENSLRFSRERFQKEFADHIDRCWDSFRRGEHVE